MVRSLLILTLGVLITAVYVVEIAFLSTFGDKGLFCGRCDVVARTWARRLLRLSDVRVVVEQAENLDTVGSCVIVANHESWFDVFALAGELPLNVKFVGKQELAKIPVFGSTWQACGHVAIDRDDRESAVRSLGSIVERMKRGIVQVVMFPEGTRSADGELQPFKKGPFILAIEAGVPIVPLAIIGSRAIMPKGSYNIGKGEVRVRIGEPISASGMSYVDRDNLKRMSQEAVTELRDS